FWSRWRCHHRRSEGSSEHGISRTGAQDFIPYPRRKAKAPRPGRRRSELAGYSKVIDMIKPRITGLQSPPCGVLGKRVGFSYYMGWREYIVSDLLILRGKPCIKGTRVPVALILGYLAAGHGNDEIIHQFPDLTKEHVAACLDYARDLAEYTAVAG